MERQGVSILHEVKTNTGIIHKWSDGLLSFIPYPGYRRPCMANLNYDLNIYMELQQGEKSPFYTELQNLNTFGGQERVFVAEKIALFASCASAVAHSAVARVIGNTFLYLNRPAIPVRMFDNREKALHWLSKQNPLEKEFVYQNH